MSIKVQIAVLLAICFVHVGCQSWSMDESYYYAKNVDETKHQYYLWSTLAYEKRAAQFKLTPQQAHDVLAAWQFANGHFLTASSNGMKYVYTGMHFVIVDDRYLFSVPNVSEDHKFAPPLIPLAGYYVNGDTGAIEVVKDRHFLNWSQIKSLFGTNDIHPAELDWTSATRPADRGQ